MTGAELQKLRHDRKLSQLVLAKIIGVSRQTISRAENANPHKNTVLRIKEALDTKRL